MLVQLSTVFTYGGSHYMPGRHDLPDEVATELRKAEQRYQANLEAQEKARKAEEEASGAITGIVTPAAVGVMPTVMPLASQEQIDESEALNAGGEGGEDEDPLEAELRSLSYDELKARGKEAGISDYHRKRKEELIDELLVLQREEDE